MAYENITKLEKLVNPEVLAAFLEAKLPHAIKFAPLCEVRNDLVGRPGDTLMLPQYAFIGYAQDVPEGGEIPVKELGKTEIRATVKKAGIGVELTDEAILSAYGDPVNEVGRQLLMAIAGKVDEDCINALREKDAEEKGEDKKIKEVPFSEFDKYVISDMMAEFGEEIEEEMTLLINSAHVAKLRRDPDFVQVNQGDVIMNGEVGRLFGVRIVISNKMQANEAYLVKAGAVKILMKRNVMVETDRNIINKVNTFVADQHYVAYLEDASKAVRAIIE